MHSLLRHIGLSEDSGDFPCAVVAEVEENHCVSLFHFSESLSGSVSNDSRLDELVGNLRIVGLFDGSGC